MVKTHNAGVYSPAAIPEVEFEITIVLEQG